MRVVKFALMCAGIVMLAGCASGGLFGSKSLPDESRVIAGPKLAVPPDFELRPPRAGEDFATKLSDEKSGEIQTLISGAPVEKPHAVQATDTDSWLLETVGGTQKVVPQAEPVSGTTATPVPDVSSEPAK